MSTPRGRLVGLMLLIVSGCFSGGGSPGLPSADGGTSGTGIPSCDALCPAVLAAKCSNGPVNQADCVNGCQTVRAGQCASTYQMLLRCGGAHATYTCNSSGQPIVVGCQSEDTALWSCLGGG